MIYISSLTVVKSAVNELAEGSSSCACAHIACMCACVRTCAYVRVCVRVHVCVYACVCVRVRTYARFVPPWLGDMGVRGLALTLFTSPLGIETEIYSFRSFSASLPKLRVWSHIGRLACLSRPGASACKNASFILASAKRLSNL